MQRSASIDDLLQKIEAFPPVEETWYFEWDETTTASLATYRAFKRYIDGDDLYLLPRTRNELESILRRYARDAVHNFIAHSRATLPSGAYSQVCYVAEKNIHAVLDLNGELLLALHSPEVKETDSCVTNNSSTRPIITK